MGRALSARLTARGHRVRVLVRRGSERKVAAGAEAVEGDALQAATFTHALTSSDTLVHLTGVAHPAPWKEQQFRAIDFASLKASAAAASAAGVRRFLYVSVAHPAPVMKAYIQVRTECEAILAKAGSAATILRPWYVLGPGHRWPVALKPIYALLEAIPQTRDSARRLGLVSLEQMVRALVWAVENPAGPGECKILDVPGIRAASEQLSDSEATTR